MCALDYGTEITGQEKKERGPTQEIEKKNVRKVEEKQVFSVF